MSVIQEVMANLKNDTSSLYRKKIDAYKKTVAHTRGNSEFLADVVLENYRASEEQRRKDNRKNIIEPLTREDFSRATDKLKNLIINKNVVKVNTDKELLDEIDNIAKRYEQDKNNLINAYDFFDFLGKFYIEFMRDDANGFLVVRPLNSNRKINERITLTFDLVYTYQVKSLENGIAYEKDNYVYFISDTSFERFYYEQKKTKKTLIKDDDYSYAHNLGIAPFIINGGVVTIDTDKETYYESFLSHSLSFANMIIKTFYDSEFLRILHAHPLTILKEMMCTNTPYCVNGIDNRHNSTCSTCNGRGKIVNFNLGATIIRKANDGIDDEDNKPIAEYIAPPLDSTELQIKARNEWQIKLKESLSLNTIDEGQSGIAKSIDERTNQISVNAVAKNIYGNLQYILNVIAKLLYPDKIKVGKEYPNVSITYPVSFAYQSESQLLLNIENFKKSGVSGTAILGAEKEYIDFKFSTNEIEKKKSDISLWYDATSHLTDETLLLYVPLNIYSRKDLLVRCKLPNVLINIASDPSFLSWSNEEIKVKLDEIFNAIPITESQNLTQK